MSARKRLSFALAALAVSPVALAQPRPEREPLRYTVRAGDTCVSISQHFYGTTRNTTLIHRANPTMGPPPHRLRAGTVLVIPPASVASNAPDALLTAVYNRVEVRAATPAPGPVGEVVATHPGRPNDPLYRGNRVNTQERSSAEVTFADETQLRLAERTLIVILGETSTRVRREASARDTVLERGTLSAFLAGVDRQRGVAPTSLNTDAARVTLDRGTEARIEVDERRRSTVAVYRGRSRVHARRQHVPVPQGYGVRAVRDQRVPAPRLLPLAPLWTVRPPRLALVESGGATLVSELREGTTPLATDAHGAHPPAPAQWHVEVSRDAHFNELIADVRGDAARSRVEIPDVEPGAYFMRVSAVDADGFQGPPSEVVSTTVARAASAVDASGARRVTVSLGLFCGLDGAPLALVSDAAIEVERRRQHTLRCALDAAGEGAVERVFEAERVGPLRVEASLSTSDATQRTASARVRVRDASGAPVAREGLRVESANPAVLAGDLNAVEGSAGDYDVALQWTRGTRDVTLRATFEDESAEATLALPEEPAVPVAPPPSERWTHRLSARAEGGVAFMLSEYQRNTEPTAFGGDAPALSTGFVVGGRAAYQLVRPDGGTRGLALAVEAGGAYWRFSAGEGSTLQIGRAHV